MRNVLLMALALTASGCSGCDKRTEPSAPETTAVQVETPVGAAQLAPAGEPAFADPMRREVARTVAREAGMAHGPGMLSPVEAAQNPKRARMMQRAIEVRRRLDAQQQQAGQANPQP